MNHFQTYN